MTSRPRALLLDFGGVIVRTRKRPEGPAELTAHVLGRLRAAGLDLPADLVERSLRAGLVALKDWKNAASRRREPLELTHRDLWQDFLVSDLPAAARETLAAQAGPLSEVQVRTLAEHHVRDGMPELLATARRLGIRVGVVSNAHSGAAHRRVLAETGLDRLIAVQVYSDEIGLRKPHPGMIGAAAQALGVAPGECWYVGDTQDRDLLAGRRAGVGAVALIRHHHTDVPPYPVREVPDAVLDEPAGLIGLLESAVPPAGAPAVPPAVEESAVPAAVPASGDATGTPVRPAAAAAAASRGGHPRPGALLLDHGGVIVTSRRDPEAVRGFAGEVAGFLAECGHPGHDQDRIVADLARAAEEYGRWKRDHDTAGDSPEITHRAYFGDLVARDWAPGPRAALVAHAGVLARRYTRIKSRRTVRPGIVEAMRLCAEHGVPVGVVSNTLCGQALRDLGAELGTLTHVGVTVFSDEAGVRKPDPRALLRAATALGVDPASCWFVGDKAHRDVACARRAGAGYAVLLDVPGRTADPDPALAADLVLPDATALHEVLTRVLAG
jgi:HAD superfamily hydrolase (TIGR01549 family)